MDIETFLEKTNWAELQKQKQGLLNILDNETAPVILGEKERERLTGLIHFLDDFQDMAVDHYGLEEGRVFSQAMPSPGN